MDHPSYTDEEMALALARVLRGSNWEAVALAEAYLALGRTKDNEKVARLAYEGGFRSLKASREAVMALRDGKSLVSFLAPRTKVGSAENVITKLFPATITEQRFSELLDDLATSCVGLRYIDDRATGHLLSDFTLVQGNETLPVNVKTAGTKFEQAEKLVGLDPDDCVPIPAYKAYAAIDSTPNLIYAVSVDYDMLGRLDSLLPEVFSDEERIVWDLLNRYSGSHVRNAEDAFVFGMIRRYWDEFKSVAADSPFNVISARKAIRILQTKPQRTPGIGLRAWGTGATAEVNVHVSIAEEMTPWDEVADRIRTRSITDIINAVNRKRVEEVYDPEI